MARKVILTETMTAELLPQMPPLRAASDDAGGGGDGLDQVGAAIAATDTTVLGSNPGVSLSEQMLALSTALAHAAHNAAALQANATTLDDAGTVRAVHKLLGAPRPLLRRRCR